MIAWVSREKSAGWIADDLEESNIRPKDLFSFGMIPFPGTDEKTRFFIPKNRKTFNPEDLSSLALPAFIKRIDLPDQKRWATLIKQALENKDLEKVVLARKTTLFFPENLDPWKVFSLLASRRKNAGLFFFSPSPEKAFLGASPERLYHRKGRYLRTEALAGTSLLGDRELIKREKEKREFYFVKEFLREQLSPLCESIEEKQDTLIQTATVQHLYCPISGKLFPHITDEDILSALHPTPAVAGTPKKAALDFLQKFEPFERRAYCGAIGCFDTDESEVMVGIRSAWIDGSQLHLFAGVGIVQGSDPEKEWQELEQKIALFL